MSLLALPLDVQRLLFSDYLCNEDAFIIRCACRALRALVPRARIDACRRRVYAHFCARGYTALLAWFVNQVPLREWCAGLLCQKAAAGGHLAALQWLRAYGAPWNTDTCARAAGGGHLAALQWSRAHGAPWDEQTCAYAAAGGHLTVLQWLRKQGAPWNEQTCAYAAGGGHLAVLQWLRANGAPWDERTCACAAGDGHLTVLQWLRANGAPWDESTCLAAARGGHLATLQWLRVNGAAWDEDTCAYAAAGGHLAVLQWSRLLAGERLCAATARRGTGERARGRPKTAMWRYWHGHASMARPSSVLPHECMLLYTKKARTDARVTRAAAHRCFLRARMSLPLAVYVFY